jgi:L-fucose isomerase-like protein
MCTDDPTGHLDTEHHDTGHHDTEHHDTEHHDTEHHDVPHLVVVATGGTERAVLDTVARRRAAVPWEPAVLVAHALHNSLPAALEALARLHRDGVPGRIVQIVEGSRAIDAVVDDLRALHRLHRTRLGLVGEPSEWLVASVPDRDGVRSRWGIEIVDVPIAGTVAHYRDVGTEAGRPVAVRFSGAAGPSAEVVNAAALHPALVAALAEADVDALTVRCFDFLAELQTSGCVALAELNDTGVVAGCEGDVAGAVAMLLARVLLDLPSWIANPAVVDVDANRVLLAHCTVAPSMVDGVELHTHFESGLGIGLRGTFRPGPVTLMRLGGPTLDRHWFADAEIVAAGASSDLCRTQVTLEVRDREVGELLDDPLGNHLVMVHGHHRARLERWWSLAFAGAAAPSADGG